MLETMARDPGSLPRQAPLMPNQLRSVTEAFSRGDAEETRQEVAGAVLLDGRGVNAGAGPLNNDFEPETRRTRRKPACWVIHIVYPPEGVVVKVERLAVVHHPAVLATRGSAGDAVIGRRRDVTGTRQLRQPFGARFPHVELAHHGKTECSSHSCQAQHSSMP